MMRKPQNYRVKNTKILKYTQTLSVFKYGQHRGAAQDVNERVTVN